MTDADDTTFIWTKIDKPYGDDELRDIARVLGIERFTNPIKMRLEISAKLYLVQWEAERPRKVDEERLYPRRKLLGTACRKVAKKARELKAAIEAPDFQVAIECLFPEEKETWPEFDREQLETLAQAAEKAATKAGKPGADPLTARRNFIRNLVPVYQSATGKKPARSHDPSTGKDSGRFLKFVKSCLSPLTPERAEGGVEDEVRLVLKAITSAEHS